MRAGRFAAEALGRAAKATIVARFSRGAFVMLDDGPVVALLPRDTPLHPWAVALATHALPTEDFRTDTQHAVISGVLDLGFARICAAEFEVADLALLLRPRVIAGAWAPSMREYLSELSRIGEMPGLRHERLDELFRGRGVGLRADNFPEAMVSLIGLGRGLTPAGDDVLIGLLAAWDYISCADKGAAEWRSRLVEAFPDPLECRTTKLSAQLLRAAAQGEYPEPLVRVAAALGESAPDRRRVERETRALLAIGHDSGTCMLQGFLAGLAHRGQPGNG